MAQTKEGAAKAVAKIREKYGDLHYHRIATKGGQASRTGGFYGRPDLARIAGAKGGKVSSREGVKNGKTRPQGQ
jgi:uncharacterized protein